MAVLVLLALTIGGSAWWILRPLPRANDHVRWEDFAPPADIAVRPWTHIVIHHSAAERGNLATIDRWHRQKGWDGIGYHAVIGNGRDMALGAVDFTFRWRLQREGAHAGSGSRQQSFNQLGLGLCLIGHFDQTAPEAWQVERTAELCAELIRHIPTLSVGRIIAHREVPGKETDCPGTKFDIERLRFLVRQRL
jgi:N-acetylmuramoyl-L-alanine amidase